MWFSMFLVLVSVSSLFHIHNLVFSLLCLFEAFKLVVSNFGFRGQDLGSDCVCSWSLLTFYFSYVYSIFCDKSELCDVLIIITFCLLAQ